MKLPYVNTDEMRDKLQDGTYYTEARRWYDVLYISPISERIFFIVVTTCAAFVFLFAFIGLIELLPIKPRVPFVYYAKNMWDEYPWMQRLKRPQDPIDPALMKFYITEYVRRHEGYKESDFLLNQMFIRNYSEPGIFNEYQRLIHPENPRSPIRTYGRSAALYVYVRSYDVFPNQQGEGWLGRIGYTVEVLGTGERKKTDWTANILFLYTPMKVDPQTQEIVPEMPENPFKVLRYDVSEGLPQIEKK